MLSRNAMKSLLLPATLLVLLAAALQPTAPAEGNRVVLSDSSGDPAFFGRIELGDAPRPRILREPMIIERSRGQVEPLYLRVRPGQELRWKLHCVEYDACGQRVYFVPEDWYRDTYAPHQRDKREVEVVVRQ